MSEWIDAEQHADRALEMYEHGRWAEAESELRKALSLNPHQPEWLFNLGLTLEAAGRDEEAFASYERTVALMPGQADPLMAAGIVAIRLEQYERAIELLSEALRIDPQSELGYAHQIESYTHLDKHDEAETTFYLAQQALDEPSAHCLAMMAESLVLVEDHDRAEWCFREALRLDPSLPRLRSRLGSIYAATGRNRRALQMYLRDLRSDPGNIDTLLDYGELLIDMGRVPEAAEKFRRILELEPANVDAHHRLGEIALKAGRYEQANLEFELVLKLDPQYPRVREFLAASFLRRNRIQDARPILIEELEIIRARNLDHVRLSELTSLGGLLLQAGLANEACFILQQAIKKQDDDPELWMNLARAHFSNGDRSGGSAASRRVIRLDSVCVIAIHNLALAALEEGRLRLAAGWISRGLKVDHHDHGLRRLRMKLYAMWIAQKAKSLVDSALPWRK